MGPGDDRWQGVEDETAAQETRFRPLSMRTKMVVSGLSFFSVFLLICSLVAPVVYDQLAVLGLFGPSPDVEDNDTEVMEIRTLNLFDFESLDITMYEREVGGTVSFHDGYASIDLPMESQQLDPGSTALLSDYDERMGCSWLYVVAEFRLRCSDDNKLVSGEGGGARLWGFSDSIYQCDVMNSIWFWSSCNESEPAYAGFWAMVVVNHTQVFAQRLAGIDMREWHDYTIAWKKSGATFLVDGNVVAHIESVPSTPLSIRVQNVAYRYGTTGERESFKGYWGSRIPVENDQRIEVDSVHVYAYEEQLKERSEIMAQVLPAAAELIEEAERKGMNTTKMRADYSQAKEQLETRDYVEPGLYIWMWTILEHLRELSELFPLALGAIQAAEQAGENVTMLQADYERAQTTWERYNYNATRLYLRRVAGIE